MYKIYLKTLYSIALLLFVSNTCLAQSELFFDFADETANTSSSNSEEVFRPDWAGLRSDSYLILSYQLAVVGVIYFLPQEISGWNKDDKEDSYRFSQYSENIQDTHWDHDQWYINYLGHPYFGATYFVVARNRGLNKMQSFFYSTTMSTLFEYGIEAFFEVPSVQDLIVTPVAGVVVGEYFYQFNTKLKIEVQRKGYSNWKDKTLLFVTDPIGAINRKVRKWTGNEIDVNVAPYFRTYKNTDKKTDIPKQNELGINFSLQWK